MRKIRQKPTLTTIGIIDLVTYKALLTNKKMKYFSQSKKDKIVGGMQNTNNDNKQE